MYNDTDHNGNDIHSLDVSKWYTIFEVSADAVSGIVDGQLTELGSSGASQSNDSGWKDLTLTGNFYNFDSDHKAQYRKVDKTVQINGLPVLNANPSALTELVIGTLPEGYRPSREVSFLCECKDDVKLWTCTVKTNGQIAFNRLRNNTGFVAGTAFADVLKLDVVFLV